MAFVGIIVVHHHRIQIQLYLIWICEFQSPDKQSFQDPPEMPAVTPTKQPEKALDHMRRSHLRLLGLDRCCVTFIPLQLVKVRQVSTGAIKEEAEHLLEQDPQRQSLAAPTKQTKLRVKDLPDTDLFQVSAEQGQPASTSDRVVGYVNIAYTS
jgi:hypothetical protein